MYCVLARKPESRTEQTGGSNKVLKTEVSLWEQSLQQQSTHVCLISREGELTRLGDPKMQPRHLVIYPFRYAMACGMNEIIYF